MFNWHYGKKLKIRKTGEIVFIVGANGENDKRRKTDWVSYIDSNLKEHEMVKGLNIYWDFVPTKDYEDERTIENHMCVFAGIAMQSLIRRYPEDQNKEYVARRAADYGEALCIELGKRDLQELVKKCYPNKGNEEL